MCTLPFWFTRIIMWIVEHSAWETGHCLQAYLENKCRETGSSLMRSSPKCDCTMLDWVHVKGCCSSSSGSSSSNCCFEGHDSNSGFICDSYSCTFHYWLKICLITHAITSTWTVVSTEYIITSLVSLLTSYELLTTSQFILDLSTSSVNTIVRLFQVPINKVSITPF